MEAQFALATRFNYAYVGLDKEFVASIDEVLREGSYTRLKEQVIERLSIRETAKLIHVLTDLTLGDGTPCQILREMGQLGIDKFGMELLKPLEALTANMTTLIVTGNAMHSTSTSQNGRSGSQHVFIPLQIWRKSY